jgi:phosphohistidine phosphatase
MAFVKIWKRKYFARFLSPTLHYICDKQQCLLNLTNSHVTALFFGGYPVDLLLIRHAEAVPLGEHGISKDTERPLTEPGRVQATKLGQTLLSHDIKPEQLLYSPLVRAHQTAEALNSVWQLPTEALHSNEELAFGGDFRKLAKVVRKFSAKSVALVGHEPDMGELAGWLIGSKKVNIVLAKGGVAFLRVKEKKKLGKGACKLVWLLTPDWT